MKATTLLKRQHRLVEKLFKQIERSKEGSERKALVTQLADALAAHMIIEEQLFYPAARQVLTGKKENMTDEAVLEHQTAKFALQNVVTDQPTSFEARVTVLKELVQHHVEDEEEEFFPEVESRIEDAQLKDLGRRMEALHEQAMASGHRKLLQTVMDLEIPADREGGSSSGGATTAGVSRAGAARTRAGANGSSRANAGARPHARV